MNRKILVVDDDPGILDAIQFILEDDGYEVCTSEKGETAENILDKKVLPQLIILDVLLSGKDGLVICKKLKSQLETKNIPIIMISAHPDAHRSSKEVGADGFLAKPFEIDDLLQLVERYSTVIL